MAQLFCANYLTPGRLELSAGAYGQTGRRLVDHRARRGSAAVGRSERVDVPGGRRPRRYDAVSTIVRRREIAWVTQRGKRSTVPLARLRTVEDCLRDPMPDQSWMGSPIPQEKFTRWLAP